MLHWAQVEREMDWDVVCKKQWHNFHHHWCIIIMRIRIIIVVKSWSLSPPADDPSLLMTMLPTICFTCCPLTHSCLHAATLIVFFLLSRIVLPKCCPGKLVFLICCRPRVLLPTFYFTVAPLSSFPAGWTGWPEHHHLQCNQGGIGFTKIFEWFATVPSKRWGREGGTVGQLESWCGRISFKSTFAIFWS